jgi:uncharacterized membrane protein SirB2
MIFWKVRFWISSKGKFKKNKKNVSINWNVDDTVLV